MRWWILSKPVVIIAFHSVYKSNLYAVHLKLNVGMHVNYLLVKRGGGVEFSDIRSRHFQEVANWFYYNFLKKFILGSSLLCRLFSSCGEQGLVSSCGVWASHCGGFSCCWAQAIGCKAFNTCGSWALEHRFYSCGAWAQLLRSEIFPDKGSNLCLLHW